MVLYRRKFCVGYKKQQIAEQSPTSTYNVHCIFIAIGAASARPVITSQGTTYFSLSLLGLAILRKFFFLNLVADFKAIINRTSC